MTPRQARLVAGLKQEDMAKLLAVHRNTYAALEKDPGRFTLAQAWQFCRVVERPLEEIFGREVKG